jgi:hypothetical protein
VLLVVHGEPGDHHDQLRRIFDAVEEVDVAIVVPTVPVRASAGSSTSTARGAGALATGALGPARWPTMPAARRDR